MFSLFIIYFGILLFLNSPKFSKIFFFNILIPKKCNKITQIIAQRDYLTCLLFRSSLNFPILKLRTHNHQNLTPPGGPKISNTFPVLKLSLKNVSKRKSFHRFVEPWPGDRIPFKIIVTKTFLKDDFWVPYF